jgi:hypothetical protein
MSEFVVVGPLKIPVYRQKLGGKRINDDLAEFWESAEKAAVRTGITGIAKEKGCYVFGSRLCDWTVSQPPSRSTTISRTKTGS